MRDALNDSAAQGDPRLAEWRSINAMRIGNFRLLDEIARGGMGIVYRARQLQPERIVALKMMLPWLTSSLPMVERFRAEANAAAQLDHPGILQIYEVGQHEGVPFFTMRFAEGGNLQQRIARYRGSWTEIAALIAHLARAAHHAHVRGILHRDLKPANILFSQDSMALIGDFGLAKWRALERNLTLPTSVLGSPYYMAPEQISGQFGGIGPTTDIYSLGAILYELLVGRTPIEAEDAVTAMRMATTQIPVAPRSINLHVPRALESVALKCLAKNPLDRYPSADALAHDLERWIGDKHFSVSGPAEQAQRFSRHSMVAAGVISVLVLGAAYWAARDADRGQVPTVDAPPKIAITGAETGSTLRAIRSLAVMPFSSDERDAANGYLSLAMRDALVAALGTAQDLRTVAAYPNTDAKISPALLAASLGVDAFVEGRISRDANRLALEVRLLRTSDGNTLWSARTFESRSDLVAAASTIALQLSAALGRKLQTNSGPSTTALVAEIKG